MEISPIFRSWVNGLMILALYLSLLQKMSNEEYLDELSKADILFDHLVLGCCSAGNENGKSSALLSKY